MDVWVIGEEGGKGDNEPSYRSVSSPPTLRLPNPVFEQTFPLDCTWPLQFQPVQDWTYPLPSTLPDLFSICLLAVQAKIKAASSSIPLFIYCHIYHLPSPTNFSFKMFFESMCSSFFSPKLLPWLRSSSSLA